MGVDLQLSQAIPLVNENSVFHFTRAFLLPDATKFLNVENRCAIEGMRQV